MPDRTDLPGGGWAQWRTELTGGDQKWWLIERDKLMRANGTGRPARTEPDPANPAVMREYPAEPAEMTISDHLALLDALIARLMTAWSRPEPLPWTAAMREALPLEVVEAVDGEAIRQRMRLQGIEPPKRASSGGSSETSSPAAAAPPQEPEPAAPPSSTPPG